MLFLIMTETEMIVALDPNGLDPYRLGCIGDAYVVASETCAFDIVGAEYRRDIEPGELLIINDEGITFGTFCMSFNNRPCARWNIFTFPVLIVILDGINVHTARKNLGKQLAVEAPIEADVVTGVPDSSISAAIGYAEASWYSL